MKLEDILSKGKGHEILYYQGFQPSRNQMNPKWNLNLRLVDSSVSF